MPGFLLHDGATVQCPHGGRVKAIPSSPRVKAGSGPVVTLSDQYLVSGCVFVLPGGKPSPCIQVKWFAGASRVTVGGKPPLVKSSTGLCMSAEGAPQGPPMIVMTQVKAKGI